MSNLVKRISSAVAGVAVVITTVMPTAGVNAAFTGVEAANKLAGLGVIVDQSANPTDYRLGDTLSRRENAKTTVNLAGLTVSDTCEGKFSDMPSSDWGCKYAEAGLAAGFFADNGKFNPNSKVSKWEALKMIMKARGIEKGSDTDYRKAYVDGAVAAGIADVFSDYDKAATRSDVFTWAANAVDLASTDNGGDLLGDLLGGLTDSGSTDSTGTTNTGTAITGGDIELSLNPSSAVSGTQIPTAGTIRFAVVDFSAGDKDVSVNTIELSKKGLAQIPAATRVWFEKNGKRLSGKAAFSSDGKAVVSFAPAYVVKAGATESLDLYVELSGANSGDEFQFAGAVTSSSADNNKGGFTTGVLRAATYTVAPTEFKYQGSDTTYNQSTDSVELARFTLENKDLSSETRDTKLQTISLRQSGNGDLNDLSDVYLERNGVKVSSEVVVSGKDLIFTVNDVIKDATTAIYYVKAKIVNVQTNGGDTYQFTLRNTSDLSVVESLNGFRSTVTINPSYPVKTYTVKGADLVFERDSSVDLSKNYAKGTSNVTLLKGTIKSKSAITLEDPTLKFTTSTGVNNLFDTLYLKIGSSVMTFSPTATTSGSVGMGFLGLATINGDTNVELYGKLKDAAPQGAVVKFDDLKLGSFTKAEYVSSQNNVDTSVGSIGGVSVSVDSTTLSVVRNDGLGDTKLAVGSKNALVYGTNLSVTQGNDVQISNAEYTFTYSGSLLNNADATLYVDGTAVSTKTINAATVKFDGLSKKVGKTATSLVVKINLQDAYSAGVLSVKLSGLVIVDGLTSQTVSLGSVPTSANFTVANAIGTLSSASDPVKANLLLAGSKDKKILAFRVKATNDKVSLRDLAFTGTNLDKLSNFKVLTPSGETLLATSSYSGSITFTNLSPADSITMDTTSIYYLVADVNTNVVATTVTATLNVSSSQVKSSNGNTVAMSGVSVTSNTHLIDENMGVIAKLTNNSKEITTSALRFSITATGKDKVVLSGATFTNLFAAYTLSGAKLVVYRDTVSAANKLGESSVGTPTGTVVFNANNEVSAGSTQNYIVVVEGIVADGSNGTRDWTVSLNNLQIGSINANAYDNLGQFPLTEVK